jgi:hypothetical protein
VCHVNDRQLLTRGSCNGIGTQHATSLREAIETVEIEALETITAQTGPVHDVLDLSLRMIMHESGSTCSFLVRSRTSLMRSVAVTACRVSLKVACEESRRKIRRSDRAKLEYHKCLQVF